MIASGSSRLSGEKPKSLALSACTHSPSGGLSIVISPPGSNETNRKLCQRAQHRLHAGRVEDVRLAVPGQAVVFRTADSARIRAERQVRSAQPRQRDGCRAVACAGRAAERRGGLRGRSVGSAESELALGGTRQAARSRASATPQQPLEVALVVPGPDRRSQPRPSGDVTQDHAASASRVALGLGVGARERDERARRRAAAPRGRARRAARPAARPACARARGSPPAGRLEQRRSPPARTRASRRSAPARRSGGRPSCSSASSPASGSARLR